MAALALLLRFNRNSAWLVPGVALIGAAIHLPRLRINEVGRWHTALHARR